jgi:hypothetical protein
MEGAGRNDRMGTWLQSTDSLIFSTNSLFALLKLRVTRNVALPRHSLLLHAPQAQLKQ